MSTYKKLVEERLAKGLCASCGGPKRGVRKTQWRCESCAAKYRYHHSSHERQRAYKHHGQLQPYAATISCLRCDEWFVSPDRRKVRHCDACRMWLGQVPTHFNEAWAEYE